MSQSDDICRVSWIEHGLRWSAWRSVDGAKELLYKLHSKGIVVDIKRFTQEELNELRNRGGCEA